MLNDSNLKFILNLVLVLKSHIPGGVPHRRHYLFQVSYYLQDHTMFGTT